MTANKILEQVFKDEFKDDWQYELRDFEHGESEFYNASIIAINKALTIKIY